MMRKTIGVRKISKLKPGQKLWDTQVKGFHARCQTAGNVSYMLFYRTKEGRPRWHTIGRHGSPWTPDMARAEAKRVLGQVVDGADPVADKQFDRNAATVSELCELYLADAEAGRLLIGKKRRPKKASTLTTDRGRIERHIKPLLGKLKIAAVTTNDVETFMQNVAVGKTAGRIRTAKKRGVANVRGGNGAASRTVGLLGGIFTYAVRKGLRSSNPVQGVVRFADGERDRRLTEGEYKLFGDALAKAEDAGIWPPAVAMARFLALTGWRLSEPLELRRREIDLVRRAAFLQDTKTDKSIRPLSNAACDLLRGLTFAGERAFPATRGDGPMSFRKQWDRVMALGGLPDDVTPNVLRHSFASLAGDLGYSELMIAALIGHRKGTVTSKYVHSAHLVLLTAADAVADRTAELMGEAKPSARVIQLHA
jgi:integrase